MSPRPRTIDDGEILMACSRVMQRVGPARFTLALVADEAGVSAATVVQRFGSKLRLLRAMSAASAQSTTQLVSGLRGTLTSPLAAAREFVLCVADMASTPGEMAHHLSWLQLDLSDAVMRRNLALMQREQHQQLARLLREATDAGELAPHDPEALARALQASATGGLFAWVTAREGTARTWLARDLEVILAPYLQKTNAAAARKEPRRRQRKR